MKRSVKVSLKFVTATKRRRLDHLLRRLRRLTNRYIECLWTGEGGLNAATLNSIPSKLGYRQRSDCLKYALEIIAATRASAKKLGQDANKPIFKRSFKFSSLTATVEPGRGSFDFVLKISGLVTGKRIMLPFKSHKRLNYWLAKPGAKLLNGCIINGEKAVLWIDLPDLPVKSDGDKLGIDIGLNKLMVDSDGEIYGTRIKEICAKVRRKKSGCKGKQRARRERDQYIRWAVKRLPWSRLKIVAVEQLKNLKTGKKSNRSKLFRKTIAPWTYCQALERIGQLAEENRVLVVTINPRGTSRTCPSCSWEAKANRVGEKFLCQVCGYNADADFVGAQNIIAKTACGNSRQSMVAESSKTPSM